MTRILISALLVTGCALKEYETNEDTGNVPSTPTEFSGGQFQMTSQGVDDNCADGSFATPVMPEGTR